MVAGKSPEWLPSGFTEKVKYKNGNKIKYYYNDATGTKYYSKKDVLSCATAENGLIGTPQSQISNGDKEISSNGKVEAELDTTDDSPKWLPDGWKMEEKKRQRGPRKGSVYKVYTDVSSGNIFYSRVAVTRYLNSQKHAVTMTTQTKSDNADTISPSMSQSCTSMTNTDEIHKEKKEESNTMTSKVDESSTNGLSITNISVIQEGKEESPSKTLDKEDKQSPLISPQSLSMTNPGSSTHGKKKKSNSFIPIASESSAADDLPSGWIKEIITSKCGSKIRKDPYYIDPISGYMFRSKPDAMRFINTNDIRYCAIRPRKRESSEMNLVKNEVQSSSAAHEKLPEHPQRPFAGGESDGSNVFMYPANSDTKLPNDTISDNNGTAEPENKAAPEEKPEQQTPKSSETEKKQTEKKPRSNPKNPRKRKDPIFPSRASKRLAGTEPDPPPPNSASATEEANNNSQNTPANSIPPFSETPKETENPPNGTTENPPNEAPVFPEAKTEAKAEENNNNNNNNNNSKQESKLFLDFGDSWSDPLEFALKTLKGEISIDDTLAAFPGCFNKNLGVPYNNNSNNNLLDGIFGPTETKSSLPDILRNDEIAPSCGSSGQQGAAEQLPVNSSAFGNTSLPPGFGGFNGQPSCQDGQTKFDFNR
ncbi:methyl-CPG-binding domain protein 13 [Striga asiatica]|uniref:Methyl-CPG-binding domain protein 13 n=1 Tax=Striga asiatica TaxID=4170 RepID=A0A5A7QHZ4_STRAF|nr:methyl-CPG-binding domain protein 13 [Striga asiatica]